MNASLSYRLHSWSRVARPHILSIVFASTLVYGWIFTETWDAVVPLLAVWDWFIVNFLNKATDTAEDAANEIEGAALVVQNQGRMELLGFLLLGIGLIGGFFLKPTLTPWRVLFSVVGLVYNYRWIPVPIRPGTSLARWVRSYPGLGSSETGWIFWTRLKETYFFKNFGSSILFTLSVFLYPRFGIPGGEFYPLPKLGLAIAFFIPLELTYEIFYDLRDIQGDRQFGVPTYPVMHGPRVAKHIILGLLLLAAIAPVAGALSGTLRLREWCVGAAVIQQLVIYSRIAAGDRLPSAQECIGITWLGAAQLFSYFAWVSLGLPLGG